MLLRCSQTQEKYLKTQENYLAFFPAMKRLELFLCLFEISRCPRKAGNFKKGAKEFQTLHSRKNGKIIILA